MFPSPSAKDKKVIVVTGCNSGVGLALVKQLVLEASSAVTGHGHFINNIEVVMACRNKVKAQAALDSLNLPSSSHTTRALVSIVECNLNSFPSIVKCCDWLKKTFPEGITSLVMNAGAIPITGIDVSLVNHLDLLTRPTWVCTTGGGFIKQRQGAVNEDGVGESFMCNTFGHYVMLKQLQGHFNTNTTNSPCRVVYVSSTSAESTKFSLEDYQGIHSKHPYESSKRAGDLMVLGLGLRRSSYTSVSADCNNDQNNNSNHTIPLPEVYSCSPGCVATNIVADIVPVWFTTLLLYILRILFAVPRLNISPENAITSILYILQLQPNLNALHKSIDHVDLQLDYSVRYSSDITRFGHKFIDTSEAIEDDHAVVGHQGQKDSTGGALALLEKMDRLYDVLLRKHVVE